ncbi:MAG TPA: HK97 gp10 family phage protein [Tepidisphaeraceae bacterium]|jgi:hypothetical protein|nr:HK97 gp10 family phage protein [Tepidisphaeraceae bacterium]
MAKHSRIRAVIKGDKALIRKLKRLGDKKRMRRVLKKATNASATPVVKAVRKLWPEDTGLSKKSIAKKVIQTKGGYAAIIGIDANASAPRAGRSASGKGSQHVPSNIDHLVELGYQTKDGQSVPAVAPLRRGFDASSAKAEQIYADKAAKEIEREAMKR